MKIGDLVKPKPKHIWRFLTGETPALILCPSARPNMWVVLDAAGQRVTWPSKWIKVSSRMVTQ